MHKSVYGRAAKLNLVVDQYGVDLLADGNDIVVVHAEVMDSNGMRLKDYEGKISFGVKGDASVVGAELGDSSTQLLCAMELVVR